MSHEDYNAQREILVAVKFQCVTIADFHKIVFRELVQCTKVHHVNLAATLGFMAVPQVLNNDRPITIAIIQEMCGPSLDSLVCDMHTELDRGLESWLDSLRIILDMTLQVLDGVLALKMYSLSHRGVKPQNACLGMDGFIKLINFGLARDFKDDGTATLGCGTAEFIPPEGYGSDLHDDYSVGVLLYNLLVADFPDWGKKNLGKTKLSKHVIKKLTKHDYGWGNIDSTLCEEVAGLVIDMTCSDPIHRLTAAEAKIRVQSLLDRTMN